MILDNVDNARFAYLGGDSVAWLQHEFTIPEYLPQREGGTVLITSRDSNAALRLVGQTKRLLKVQAMSISEAKAILDNKLEARLGSDEERTTLTVTLDCIPLALTQAAAYIDRRQRMNITRYLGMLRKDREKEASLLRIEESDLRRNNDASNSILRTWQITFDQIRTYHKSAANLLSQMSLFDRKGIPEFLLRANATENEFEEAIDILLRYAIINSEIGGTNFEMHRLVQISTTIWLQHIGEFEQHKEFALQALTETYPTGNFENWATCLVLEPHAQSLLIHNHSADRARLSRAKIQRNRAWYYAEQGNYSFAEQIAKQSLLDTNELLGDEHPDTLTSMANLASTYWNQGRWKEAEELEVQVMETRKRVLGEEHPSTITSMANLASTYRNEGRWKEAEELFAQVMVTSKRVLGDEHPDTLTNMANLASTYWNQGRWKEAEELEVQVMERRKRLLGEEHPSTLTSMNNLAFTFMAMDGKDEAIRLMETTVRLRKKVLGPDHPYTKSSASALASWTRL